MKKILFVCTANIARSPIAEVMFNKIIGDLGLSDQFQASSAGTWARNGNHAAADGQKVMLDRGLDTSSHRSRVVTRKIMEDADLILTMESGHKEALQVEFPNQRDRVFVLTEMVGPAYDIGDPYGRFLEHFERTADEIDRILEKGMEKILALAV